MKKFLLSLLFSGVLMASESMPQTFSSAVAEGTIIGVLNLKKGAEAADTMSVVLSAYKGQKLSSEYEEKGVFYGVAALPTILNGSKMSFNLSGETLSHACDFFVSFDSQDNKLSEKERSEMKSGCVFGYGLAVIANSKQKN